MADEKWRLTELDIKINSIINEAEQIEIQSRGGDIIDLRIREKKRNAKLLALIHPEPTDNKES